jgi:hypothetical protein
MIASLNLQEHLHIEKWLKKWKIKVNESKLSHKNVYCPAVNINPTITPQTEAVKYLVLHFDCRLNGREHIAKNRKQTDLKTKEINWLIRKKSHLQKINYSSTKR